MTYSTKKVFFVILFVIFLSDHSYASPDCVNLRPSIILNSIGNLTVLKSDSTVLTSNGTTAYQDWNGIIQIDDGVDFTVGLKNDGSVVGVGNNNYGQLNFSSWSEITKVAYSEPNLPLIPMETFH